jgi:cell division protein FtsB
MITRRMIVNILALSIFVFFLSIEKVKLSWEISILHNNYENLRVENANLKDQNLKLITQFYTDNAPANIERIAKESMGMIKKSPKRIVIDE